VKFSFRRSTTRARMRETTQPSRRYRQKRLVSLLDSPRRHDQSFRLNDGSLAFNSRPTSPRLGARRRDALRDKREHAQPSANADFRTPALLERPVEALETAK